MSATIGYALLVDMRDDGPITDGVYMFTTEQEAVDFAVGRIAATVRESSKRDVLETYQDGLVAFDYYHIREVKSPEATS